MRNVVIAGYARSPFTFANKGGLRKVRPDGIIHTAYRQSDWETTADGAANLAFAARGARLVFFMGLTR